jgi:PAS domain S-box-containing protein
MGHPDAPGLVTVDLGILFERHPQPMWLVDQTSLRFLAVNDAAVGKYGYSRAEFLAMTACDLRPAEEVPRLTRMLQERPRHEGHLSALGTWRHRKKDGSIIDVEMSLLDLDFEGRPAGLAIAYDVTARVETERRLALSEQRLQDAQAVAHLGSWEWDSATGEAACSRELYRMYGVTPEAFTPPFQAFLALVHPDERAEVTAHIERARGDHSPLQFETRIVRPDGALRHILVRGEYIPAPNGAVRMVGVSQDITERAHLLARERAARAEAETALARLRQIHAVTDTALALLGLDELLDETLSRLRAAIGADIANVLLLSENGPWLVVRASQGLESMRAVGDAVPVARGIAGRVAALRQAVAVEDVSTRDGLRVSLRGQARSMMAAPLLVEGQVVGVLDVATRETRRFGDEDLRFLQLVADRVAPVIDRARVVEMLAAGKRQLSIVSQRLVETQEAERADIARELHDEVGQLLTGLKLMLETPGPADRREEMKAIVNDLMARVRGLSLSLRPPMLDDLGLVPALLWLVQHYSGQTGVQVDLCHLGLEPRLRAEVETAAFRIVQEALTNVARHAEVKAAAVRLEATAGHLLVQVRDQGRGFDVQAKGTGSAGLAGMRERARLVWGHLTVDSRPGRGTLVSAVLPLEGPPDPEA